MITTHRRYAQEGFSLIEIMIAIAIIAIIAVTVGPLALNQYRKAQIKGAESDLRGIQQGIDLYYADIGQYPTSLRDLVKRPEDEAIARKWHEGYLKGKDTPKDRWGNKYEYELTPGKEHPYELYSYGPKSKGAPKNEQINAWTE
jgi:general secretion pathway protein G